jgi:2-methylcitrate dehydratase PrpD
MMSALSNEHIDPASLDTQQPLAVRMARVASTLHANDLSVAVCDKVKLCLYDLIGCAFEAKDLPWSRQAVAVAARAGAKGRATIVGADFATSYEDAAFANAVQGHGLVREDMHSASISHLGIVVLPVLLALAQYRRVSGGQFIAAAVIGYEAGGSMGRALLDAEIARIHRPTGITGPVAGAIAAARLLDLALDATTSAVALGANSTLGFNQWAHTGGSEMFFQAGFAARNALTAARLAEAGAFASPSALDGEAGLFASLGKRSAANDVHLLRGSPEILSVYHKPVPACNFAQTPCQAALVITRKQQLALERIAAITIRVPRAGALYPGCNYAGPFQHVLQAKMSIQYNVAATLIERSVTEKNFTLLSDARLHRLIGMTTLLVDDRLTQAYPGNQGAEVEVRDVAGEVYRARLDDVVNAGAQEVRARFHAAAAAVLGADRAAAIAGCIDGLEGSDDAGRLSALLSVDGE